MAALSCDICGGSLVMDPNGKTATCSFCGMQHTQERLKDKIQEIKGKVSIEGKVNVKGIDTKESLHQKANTYITLKDFEKAISICEKIIENYPDDCLGYWQLTMLLTGFFKNVELTKDEYSRVEEYSRRARFFADSKDKVIYNNIWQEYEKNYKQHLTVLVNDIKKQINEENFEYNKESNRLSQELKIVNDTIRKLQEKGKKQELISECMEEKILPFIRFFTIGVFALFIIGVLFKLPDIIGGIAFGLFLLSLTILISIFVIRMILENRPAIIQAQLSEKRAQSGNIYSDLNRIKNEHTMKVDRLTCQLERYCG